MTERGAEGGGTDIVPTGANCALQTYKYIKKEQSGSGETIVVTSRDGLLKALQLLPQGQQRGYF